MGEFNSDDHYIYYCGQESLRRNGVAIIVNKRVWNEVLGCNLENDRMNSLMDSVGEGEGGKIWENGIETYKISCMKKNK